MKTKWNILVILALKVTTGSAIYPDANTPEIVFIIPVGQDGVKYDGERPEMLTWGPTAFAIAADGSFWIADTVGNRLLHYRPQGKALNTIDLNDHQVVGVGDLEITASNILVLDIAAILPRVLRLSPDGELLASYPVPKELGLANGLSGIAVGDQGQVLIEREDGAFVSQLVDSRTDGCSLSLRERVRVRGKEPFTAPTVGRMRIEPVRVIGSVRQAKHNHCRS